MYTNPVSTENRNKRKVSTLLKDGTTSCAHLQCMKRNYDHWEHMKKRSDKAESRESSHVCFFRIYFMVTFIGVEAAWCQHVCC